VITSGENQKSRAFLKGRLGEFSLRRACRRWGGWDGSAGAKQHRRQHPVPEITRHGNGTTVTIGSGSEIASARQHNSVPNYIEFRTATSGGFTRSTQRRWSERRGARAPELRTSASPGDYPTQLPRRRGETPRLEAHGARRFRSAGLSTAPPARPVKVLSAASVGARCRWSRANRR
jgi:hypothetical protein